ncbi:50S ribosomal protein L1 [uncultured archaeon]|nr:50S ribosomal protein L1 [uncultured archaeon]
MSNEENFANAIKKLRETKEKKNFDQTIDLIVNLKGFDVRREAFNTFIQLPNKVKNKRIAAFLEKESKAVDTIKKDDFPRYKEKKDIKKLIKKYDFFIASAKLMPAIATSFGRFLGPVGKMPSPQLGILPSEEEPVIKAVIEKINSNVRVRVKEPSIKIGIGKESLTDEQIMRNAITVYAKLIELLPRKNDNIRNIKIKSTMGKPINVQL